MTKQTTWLLAGLVFIIFVGIGVFFWMEMLKVTAPIACTMEAKICPDGSSVGRSGPNCDFAACPSQLPLQVTIYCASNKCQPQQIMSGAGTLVQGCFRNLADCTATSSTTPASSTLQTFIDSQQNFQFQYPEKLSTVYITAQTWPPIVTATAGNFSCAKTATNNNPSFPQVVEKNIGGQDFCIKTIAEGAAGSVYTTYDYLVQNDGKVVDVNFTLQAVQCLNYDNPRQAACLAERQAFSPDNLGVQIANSLKFLQDKSDLIKVNNIKPNQVIKSPLIIKGQARGSWFFEAVFPIDLYDAQGREIATTQARALSDWTTSDFVPFQATLTFKALSSTTGVLNFNKDNPSGMPQNDDKLSISVKF